MTVRCLVCPRCNRLCRATYQDTPIGVGDVFRAKGVLRAIGALVGLALQDDIEPHDAMCGKPCGEGMFDGISRHTGLDCPECKGAPPVMPPKHDGATVTAALAAFRGNLSAAARSLGHDPKTLWQRVQRNPALWPEGVPRLFAGGMPGSMRRSE